MTGDREHILIIDDDVGMGVLLKRELKKADFVVDTCTTAQEALDRLVDHQPSLMLVDLSLPDISGQELIKALDERGQKIPFIIVSGMSDLRVAVEMMQEGALDFVLKDANMLGLVVPIVKRVLQTLKIQQELYETRDRLFHISEVTNDVFWMIDARTKKFLYLSPSYEKVWGHSAAPLYEDAQNWLEAIEKEDRSKYLRGFENFREGFQDFFDETYRIRRASGEVRWVRDRGYASRDGEGNVDSFSGVATDVTRRKDLESQVLEATEQERIRIGQDLHDDLCQRLAALKLACGRVASTLDSEQKEALGEIEKEIGEATSLSRSIARGLSPVSLEDEGLMVALEQLAQMMENRFGVICRFDCPVPVAVTSQTRASNVFRIAQELMNNAVKHGKPSRIMVGLYPAAGGFKLEVVNDGIPFRGPSQRAGGMGLHFMQFRADALGATLDFTPGKMPDGGTRVVCLVPQSEIG